METAGKLSFWGLLVLSLVAIGVYSTEAYRAPSRKSYEKVL